MIPYLFLVLLLFTGCMRVTQTYTPDGRIGHIISCPGTMRSWGDCYEKAGEICGVAGYTILAHQGDHGYIMTGTPEGMSAGSVMNRTLMIACQ